MLPVQDPPTAPPSLLLVPDLRPGVGYGHLSRSLAMAEEWTRRGGTAYLEGIVPPEWVERCRYAGVRVVEPGSAAPREFDWTVVDGYEVGPPERARARTCPNVVAIDDHRQGGWAGHVDLVVDPNVGAVGRPPGSLAGARYALIRRDVLSLAGTAPQPRSVVVVGGGSPPQAVLAWMEGLANSLPGDVQVDVVRGGRDLPRAMAAAKVIVTAAGTALLEACALRRPVLAFTWARNQRPGAVHLAAAGVEVVGDVADIDPAEVATTVARLLDDADRVADLTRACASLVDGRGARRVVSRLLGGLVDVREADGRDTDVLWRWVNDPAVRSGAFSTGPVAWEDHVGWTAAKLADPATDIAIALWSGTPIGQVRFDKHGRRADIDVSLDLAWRGSGLGAALLSAATDWYLARHSDVDAVDAAVRVENAASQTSFLDADFDTDGSITDRPAPHLRYSRSRNAAGPAG